jgi:hypothetical protein
MIVTTSYAVDIRKDKALRNAYKATLDLYRCAVSWYIAIVQVYWNDIVPIHYLTKTCKNSPTSKRSVGGEMN